MSKNTAQEIIDLGFAGVMFRKQNETDFGLFLDAVLAEQALILEGRIGSAAYTVATSPQKDYVKLAEKYLVAAELMSRRITVVCEAAVGSGEKPRTDDEQKQRNDYRDRANEWITKIVDGSATDSTSGLVFGSLTTNRFQVSDS